MKRLFLCIFLLGLMVGVSVPAAANARSDNAEGGAAGSNGHALAAWKPLMVRLQKDGFSSDTLQKLFNSLTHGYSTTPMGVKAKELYRRKYERSASSGSKRTAEEKKEPAIYSGVVVDANLKKAKVFLQQHEQSFASMEERYGVPREVAVGLMLVETRLGAYLGSVQAFRNLACLANTPHLEQVMPHLKGKQLTSARKRYLSKRVKSKSDWAYGELKALLEYSEQNQMDAVNMPGSIYGAVGICQFMPSNILIFGVDGNGDGRVNLFDVEDAVHSLANYLKQHGWKDGLGRSGQHRVLKRYNHSNMYANTILAVAEALGY